MHRLAALLHAARHAAMTRRSDTISDCWQWCLTCILTFAQLVPVPGWHLGTVLAGGYPAGCLYRLNVTVTDKLFTVVPSWWMAVISRQE